MVLAASMDTLSSEATFQVAEHYLAAVSGL